jgi:hypothetical protein
MRRFADSLHTGIFFRIAIAWSDNVTMECAADCFAIFHDSGGGAYLNATVLKHFDAVNYFKFF